MAAEPPGGSGAKALAPLAPAARGDVQLAPRAAERALPRSAILTSLRRGLTGEQLEKRRTTASL
jgi:hypothetical protein